MAVTKTRVELEEIRDISPSPVMKNYANKMLGQSIEENVMNITSGVRRMVATINSRNQFQITYSLK